MKTGVECEFFLIAPDGTRHLRRRRSPDEALLRPAGADAPLRCHHRNLRRHARARLGPYQNDHEDANGQFEMNWEYDDALMTADRHAFFKYMVKSIAEKHGLRATFMPKPFAHLTGNGCHAHVSLWDRTGKNLFDDRERRARPVAARLSISSAASWPCRGAVRASPIRPSTPISASMRRARSRAPPGRPTP